MPEHPTPGPANARTGLRRGLGAITLAATIFIFVSSGPYGLEPMVRDGGPGAAILMLVLALLFWGMSHALVAAELSSAIPEEGGFVRWIGMAFGPFWGFQSAWWYWIKMLADTSIYPILFAQYLLYWFPDMTPWQGRLVRVAVVWLFVGINLRGIELGGRLAAAFSLFLMAPVVLFVFIGLPEFHPALLQPLVAAGRGTIEGLGLALMFGMWCYNTLDSVSIVAGEVDNPTTSYRRAYAIVIPCIFLGYIVPVLAGLGVDPAYAGWTDHHFTTMAYRVGGALLGGWMSLAALSSNISLFHAALMVNTRVPFVLAREKRFPAAFAMVGRRFGAPWVSLLFDGAVYTTIALLVEEFVDIVVWNQWLNAGIYTLFYLSFLRLRRTRPDLPRRFRIPGGWPVALAICTGPFFICWLGVPLGGRRLAWLGLSGLASGPLAWMASRALSQKRTRAEGTPAPRDTADRGTSR